MAKVLMGAVITAAGVEATYKQDIMGEEKTLKKTSFPASVLEKAKVLIDACDALTPELGDCRQVQIYTPVTDPVGTDFSKPGELLDVTFSGMQPQRIGESKAVDSAIAAARDALKTEIVAAL